MKVGTDAVLLGASIPLDASMTKVLDIGSGTGVLSLMMAQRLPLARITAIEIDEGAAKETAFNFQSSPFSNSLESQHSSLQSFVDDTNHHDSFNLIVCNPPFFKGSQAEGSRKKARDSFQLPAAELIAGVDELFSKDGQFSLVIPFPDEVSVVELAKEHSLFPFEILRVRGRRDSKIIRSLLHFKRGEQILEEKEMFIEIEERHDYSEEYLELVQDFLLLHRE